MLRPGLLSQPRLGISEAAQMRIGATKVRVFPCQVAPDRRWAAASIPKRVRLYNKHSTLYAKIAVMTRNKGSAQNSDYKAR
jgi:hypothetical protein